MEETRGNRRNSRKHGARDLQWEALAGEVGLGAPAEASFFWASLNIWPGDGPDEPTRRAPDGKFRHRHITLYRWRRRPSEPCNAMSGGFSCNPPSGLWDFCSDTCGSSSLARPSRPSYLEGRCLRSQDFLHNFGVLARWRRERGTSRCQLVPKAALQPAMVSLPGIPPPNHCLGLRMAHPGSSRCSMPVALTLIKICRRQRGMH